MEIQGFPIVYTFLVFLPIFTNFLLNTYVHRLKFLLQLMASSQAKRDMVYYTFGDKSLQNDITEFHSYLIANKCVVSDVS